MKNYIFRIATILAIIFATYGCKEKEKDASMETEEIAEASSQASSYIVDTKESTLFWKGNKPLGSHHGTVNIAEGTLSMNKEKLEAGNFVINMTSINDEDLEGDKKTSLESHLKGTAEGKEGDFFNVNEFPSAKFEMTSISYLEGKNVQVSGNLTIKDKTNPVEFSGTLEQQENMIILKSAPFEIDRTKWGVNYGSKSVFDNLGDKYIDDMMEITVRVVARR